MALAATSAVASAEELEDPDYAEFPLLSPAIGVQRHVQGIGPVLELALGNGRWQYLAEGSLDRRMERAAVGVRWLARQFAPTERAGLELFLVATAGEQRLRNGMGTTPELTVGPGFQLRGFSMNRFVIRVDARAVFTNADRTTFLAGMGLAW